MADVSKLNLNDVYYNIKDAAARKKVILSVEQPTDQLVGDFWYQDLSVTVPEPVKTRRRNRRG